MKSRPVEEQVVVVVGASSGIGRETALTFAQRGAKVVVSARGEEGLDSLVEAIRGMGGDAFAVPADVTDAQSLEALAAKAVERYGRLDTWAHLAAVSLYARFEDTTPEEFEQVVNTNLVGAANGAMAALPRLRASGGGTLILVSSVEAIRALPYQSAYAAAKHGIDGLAEALRVELRREKAPVTVTHVLPSAVDTPLFEHARTRLGVRPKGFPPMYDARVVARAIVHAATRPTRRLVVGGAGRIMDVIDKVAPAAMDTFLTLAGFRTQRTKVPKTPAAPDNLEEPLDFAHSVSGGPETSGRNWSLYTSWRLNRFRWPASAALVIGTALLAGGALAMGDRSSASAGARLRPGRRGTGDRRSGDRGGDDRRGDAGRAGERRTGERRAGERRAGADARTRSQDGGEDVPRFEPLSRDF